MVKQAKRGGRVPAHKKGKAGVENGNNTEDSGGISEESLSIFERVKRESEQIKARGGPGEGRKRVVARMAFFTWLTSPVRYRGAPEQVLMTLGLSGDMLELTKIATFKEFGEKFDVGHGALAEWAKEFHASEQGQDHRVFFRGLMKEALGALYRKVIENGDADRFKVLAQYAEGWMPGVAIGNPGDVNDVDPARKKAMDELIAKNKGKEV